MLSAALLGCVWVFLRDPLAGPARCVDFGSAAEQKAFSKSFNLQEPKFKITLHDALASGTGNKAPAGLENAFEAQVPIDENFQRWAVRNTAFHLWRARNAIFASKNYAPHFAEKRLNVEITPTRQSYGLTDSTKIFLGGVPTLSSDFIYHEYAHHVLDWANPSLMKNRKGAAKDPDGYALIEVFANHLAFALDDEPAFGEYDQSRKGGRPEYAYRVDTNCTLASCQQAAFRAGRVYQVVILFGSVLWELRQQVGPEESVYLMLDSLRYAPKDSPLTVSGVLSALKKADLARNGGANVALLEKSFTRRFQ